MAGFGFGTSTFGTTTQAPSFGSFPSAPTSAPGFSFGNTPKTMAPAFGLSFTNPTTSAPAFGTGTGFGFGNTLGAAPSTSANTGFSFGLGTTTTAPSTGFSFGGLGSTPSTAPSFSFGGLGTTTSAPTFAFGGLGGNASTAPSGLSFGQTGTLGGGGGLFALGTGIVLQSGGMIGVLGSPTNVNTVTNIAAALSLPIVYGDERDAILAKWNQLQAFWGTGKGYFSTNAPPVEFTSENPFCRFKAIGYSCMPTAKPEEGLVGLIFNKKEHDFRNQQQQIVDNLHRLFGSKPTLCVCVEGIKSLPDDRTEAVFYILERAPTGVSRHIPSQEVCSYLEQATLKPQLASLEVLNILPKVAPTKEQLQHYLDNPPAGIDPLLWQQAKLDNPDPKKMIPVPMIGFTELHRRLKCQEYQTKQHQERLDIIAEDIAELHRRHATTVAKIAEHKRKQLELGHRVLKIMVLQEVTRKMGFAIQADEEQLRIKLEALQAELSAPTQFKGHLKELISQIRMQNHQLSFSFEGERYSIDELSREEIRQHLRFQQDGIAHLINILKEDFDDLKVIESGLKEAIDRRR